MQASRPLATALRERLSLTSIRNLGNDKLALRRQALHEPCGGLGSAAPAGPMVDFQEKDGQAVFRFPATFYDTGSLETCVRRCRAISRYRLATGDEGVTNLHLQFPGSVDEQALCAIFSDLNQFPVYPGSAVKTFRNSRQPLVSCIIVLTANDRFVRRFLIPSILASSQGYDIELIIVYNGAGADLGPFSHLRVLQSEFASVPKAYNRGVAEAKGQYVAIFHDDCILMDAAWIDRARELLTGDTAAVTPEIQRLDWAPLEVAKNVPLVMKKSDYERLGGYDEYYYGGLEDVDFTLRIVTGGRQVRRLDVRFLHFNGMSTVIMWSEAPGMFRRLFALHMLPMEGIRRIKEECLRKTPLEVDLVLADHCVYFLRKFESYLQRMKDFRAASVKDPCLALLERNCGNPVLLNREALIDFYRKDFKVRETKGRREGAGAGAL